MMTLTGSPKQIAWAEDIRTQALSHVDDARSVIADYPHCAEQMTADLDAWIAEMHAQTSAKAWIDARAISYPQALAEMVRRRNNQIEYGTPRARIFGR